MKKLGYGDQIDNPNNPEIVPQRELTYRYEATGEVRPPNEGEWFKGHKGPVQARFDFTIQSFPILRLVVEEIA